MDHFSSVRLGVVAVGPFQFSLIGSVRSKVWVNLVWLGVVEVGHFS